jgi:hypothetical protein
MKIEHEQDGDVTLDPDELAREFNLSPAQFRRYLRQGMVTSRIERGEGEDLGKARITVRIGNRVWQAIVDSHSVVHRDRKVLGGTPRFKPTPRPPETS